MFGNVYKEAGVVDNTASAGIGLDASVLNALVKDGVDKKFISNAWIGRLGP